MFAPYTTREAALAVLEPYREPFRHDGFLEFGIIFQLHGHTEEVFVTNVKFIRIWTNLSDKVVAVLRRPSTAARTLSFTISLPAFAHAGRRRHLLQ
jgi:hypothetical protein